MEELNPDNQITIMGFRLIGLLQSHYQSRPKTGLHVLVDRIEILSILRAKP